MCICQQMLCLYVPCQTPHLAGHVCCSFLLLQALAALDRARDELACQLDASREEAAQLAEEAAAARSAADETAR